MQAWTVLEKSSPKNKKAMWLCKCICGTIKPVNSSNLMSKSTKSCGCLKNTREGLTHTPEGSSWGSMMTRCFNENNHTFKRYGGAGITVCAFLRKGPDSLIAAIGNRPNGHSIERIDNLGNYSCGNCQDCIRNGWSKNIAWATKLQQNRNQSDLNYITINGVTKCLSEWAEHAGIKRSTLSGRFMAGWRGERLLMKALR